MLNTYLLYLDLGRIQCISLYLEQEPPPTTLLRRNETQREYETDDDRSRIIVRIRRFVTNRQCSLIRCCRSTTRTIGVGVGDRWHRGLLYFNTLGLGLKTVTGLTCRG